MAFIGFLIFWAISFIAGQLLRATQKQPKPPKGEVEAPQAEEGTQIPAIFGTVKIAPNTLWFGDVDAVPVKKRVSTGLFTSTRQTIGYKYLVGMQGGLCWGPVDALVEIILADKYKATDIPAINYRKEIAGLVLELTTTGVTPSLPIAQSNGTAITFDAPFVYGGPEREGGVAGTVRFYFGTTGQSANSYLGTHAPAISGVAYKGLCYAVWEHTDMGQSQYLKQWQFVLRRCPTTLGTLVADTSLSRIGDDANPAEVLYELLTDTRWGLSRPSTDYNVDSFTTALQTLSDEGLGISGTHLGASTAEEKVKQILGTIDAVLAPDPLTGLITLTLIRADYDAATLETFTPSNSRDLTYSRPDAGELTTEVKVRYTDASQLFTTRARPAYNPALRQIAGRDTSLSVDYPLITTGANADRLALRDLKAVSSTLATGSLVATRAGSHIASGHPFKINDPDQGLTNLVARATRVNYGTIHGSEDVEIQWTEDVFGVASGVFTTDPPDVFVPPPPPSFGSVVVIPEFTLSDTEGCVTLQITGAVDSISTIEMRRQKGGEAAEGWVEFDIDDPPLLCVARDDIDTGVIAWRVTVTEADATTDTIEGEQEVPPLGVEGDPGSGEGRPGNLGPFPFAVEAGGLYVLGTLPSTLTPFTDCGQWRLDSSNSTGITLWGHVAVAGASGSYKTVEVSADNGSSWTRVDPEISLGSVGVKTVSGALPAEGIGGSILFRASAGGGDDVESPELYNFAFALTVETPVVSAPPDLPEDGDDIGIIIDDRDATTLGATYADGASLTAVADVSASMNPDAIPVSGIGQTAPTYSADGFTGGLPCMVFNAVNNGLKITGSQITNTSFTMHVVAEAIGSPSSPGIGHLWDAPSGTNKGKGVTLLNPAFISGNAMGVYVNDHPSFPTFVNFADDWDRSVKHIYTFTFEKGSGAFTIHVDNVLKATGSAPAQFTEATDIYIAFRNGFTAAGFRAGRFVTYDRAQGTTARATVLAALQAYWGTP